MEREIPEWEKELHKRRLVATFQAETIGTKVVVELQGDSSLSENDRYLTYVALAEFFGWRARTEGRSA